MTRAQPPAGALFRPAFLQILDDNFELLRRGRKIEKAIAARAAFLVEFVEPLGEFLVAGFIAEFALVIEKGFGEPVPDFIAHRLPGIFTGRFLHFGAEFVIRFRTARETDHRNCRRQLAIRGDIVESGHQLAMGEVAGRAEDHDRARLRNSAGR